jgi:hypothetical protein
VRCASGIDVWGSGIGGELAKRSMSITRSVGDDGVQKQSFKQARERSRNLWREGGVKEVVSWVLTAYLIIRWS